MRVPKILDDTVTNNAFPPDVVASFALLRQELVSGHLCGLVENTLDRDAWDRACAPHVGKSWLDIPWYFAESFFYRRVLEASHYFTNGLDPFAAVKRAEEAHSIPLAASFPRDDLTKLLHASLWGNRADLSYDAGLAHGRAGGTDDLLVDDTAAVLSFLTRAKRIALILDNAGSELSFDLLLADALRARGISPTLFAKSHPFFVSDATPVDVDRTATALGLAEFAVEAPSYMTSSGFFFDDDMPADLRAHLGGFDLVILKGDANYRRLVGDAPWAHDTLFADAISFPAPCVALRTCKAEVLIGIDDVTEARARSKDASWLVSGRFGVIQAKLQAQLR